MHAHRVARQTRARNASPSHTDAATPRGCTCRIGRDERASQASSLAKGQQPRRTHKTHCLHPLEHPTLMSPRRTKELRRAVTRAARRKCQCVCPPPTSAACASALRRPRQVHTRLRPRLQQHTHAAPTRRDATLTVAHHDDELFGSTYLHSSTLATIH